MPAPIPPPGLPPGHVIDVPGVGELFVRDSGAEAKPVVLLLHGWGVSADVNWWRQYAALEQAGYRVLALDARGHGRGLRSSERFRLLDCANDCAALLRRLEIDSALVVGYSMGGPIAQLLARDHPQVVSGLVFCCTAQNWKSPRMRVFWFAMMLLRFAIGAAPYGSWRVVMRLIGFPRSAVSPWGAAELTRGSARDLARAVLELMRHDAGDWIGGLKAPAAVIVTTEDSVVSLRKQRELAKALPARATYDVAGGHFAAGVDGEWQQFRDALLSGLSVVSAAPASSPVP
jgi:pimeloyl-ACP methyl ester carboxylesterase